MTNSEAALPLLSRYAIMVDVGYIYASAGELLFSAASRREYRVDADRLISALVRLRLGNLNARGQQKGVDAQIRADMEALARHRAITDAILVAGDEDMVPAVEAAQAFGVRVHLWGVEPPYGTNQAERLVWESDTVEVLERAFIDPFFAPQPTAERRSVAAQGSLAARSDHAAAPPGAPAGPGAAPSPAQLFGDRNPFRSHGKQSPAIHLNAAHIASARLGPSRERVEEAGEHVAQKWILTRGEDNIRDLLPGPILPPVIDKELLVDAEKELGLSLRAYQEAREWLRDAFWARVHRQFGVGVGKSRS